jgi:tetratricopeptide (TPR) repeat protein
MREQSPFHENKEELNDLLQNYYNLKRGLKHIFLEEESFEKIIDYFDENDSLHEALEASEIGMEQFPYSALLMVKKADLLISSRKYIEAIELLEQASLYDNSDINLYILKTDAYLALDQQQDAIEILQQALQIFEGDERIELLFELADVYDDYEAFDKVFDCLKLILADEPNNEEALYKICFWTDFTGRNEESITMHKSIIEEYPFNEIAWFNLAAAYQGIKLYEKAIDAYQYAIAIDEKFDYAYRNMGDAYLRLRKFKEAIEALEKVLELTRPEDVIYEAIGHCYHRLGNIAQARFNYKKAVHLNPDDSKLHFKIANTYMLEQQWQSAIKQLDQAMRMHRNIPEYNIAMGECKMNLGLYKEAVHFFGYVVRNRPKNTAGWEALIRCLFIAKYYQEAMEQCISAIKMTESKPIFIYYFSASLFFLGKPKEAIIQLEKGIQMSPKLLKKFIALNPSVLQNNAVVDIILRNKKSTKK